MDTMMRSVTRTGTKDPGYKRHPGSNWIEAHRNSLPDNQWVAANAAGAVAMDPTIDGLMGQLRAKDLHPADVAIAFVTPDSA
jgi:hypothetical protein